LVKKQYVSYSKCFKPKEESKLLPEYLVFLLKNKDTKKPRMRNWFCPFISAMSLVKPPPTASFDF
jgi:hypothetical protein